MKDKKLDMYGGALGGSFPLILFITGMIVVTFAGTGGLKLIGLLVGFP